MTPCWTTTWRSGSSAAAGLVIDGALDGGSLSPRTVQLTEVLREAHDLEEG